MNQKKINDSWNNERLPLVAANRLLLRLTRCYLFFVVVGSAGITWGQNSFQPQSTNQSFQAPWAQGTAQNQLDASAPTPDAAMPSFPQTMQPFDSEVRTANFESAAPEAPGTNDSMSSAIDSTATMLSNFKDATGEQLSGLATSFSKEGSWTEKVQTILSSSDTSRMLGSLTLVLGLYFAFVWVMRKFNPNGNAGLPPEVVEVMGQVPFGPKRHLQLVRLGSKLLLLINSPEGTQSIGEITDPVEVEYLGSLCTGKRKSNSNHVAALQRVAQKMVHSNQTAAPAPPAPSPAATQHNLANILKTLDHASKQNSAVFEV